MIWSMLVVAKFYSARFYSAKIFQCSAFVLMLSHTQMPNRDGLGLRAYYALESNSCQRPIRSTGLSPIEIDSCTKTLADSALDS